MESRDAIEAEHRRLTTKLLALGGHSYESDDSITDQAQALARIAESDLQRGAAAIAAAIEEGKVTIVIDAFRWLELEDSATRAERLAPMVLQRFENALGIFRKRKSRHSPTIASSTNGSDESAQPILKMQTFPGNSDPENTSFRNCIQKFDYPRTTMQLIKVLRILDQWGENYVLDVEEMTEQPDISFTAPPGFYSVSTGIQLYMWTARGSGTRAMFERASECNIFLLLCTQPGEIRVGEVIIHRWSEPSTKPLRQLQPGNQLTGNRKSAPSYSIFCLKNILP